MKQIFPLLIIFLIHTVFVFGQDTLYFNNHERVHGLQECSYFLVVQCNKADTSRDFVKRYTKAGKISYEGDFSHKTKRPIGQYKEYYQNGQLKKNIQYNLDSHFNGQLCTYWNNGKSKRIDTFDNGILMKGKCYTYDGKDTIHTDYIQTPKFVGGQTAMIKFISGQLHYPNIAQKMGVTGRVIVGFIVEKNGTISHVKVVRSVNPDLDAEAIKIVNKMPKWIPGNMDGDSIRVSYKLPIYFKLTDNSEHKQPH